MHAPEWGSRSTTRVALFPDVHGNAIALDTGLADTAAAGEVDARWFAM
ncbi:MAG: hypothetical protein M3440_04445 [Chloroflexota bacterium]|nr:hypothetical protein [Chloroflexota bacterium]